ncbi:putative kinetoplast-associated protein kap-like protein [Ophiocordyceps camponoti-floridani]|uniref:Putative kinetoplast-associated protein kap-like protein n=1 Tax=Ophiocordyceps camponoti-floridani TaxID=2030778 RepID=A0A8H4VCR4_9HYPO|nr:putative kinetoplast-associated protein kap-like protein [Ophiocordyceps camponoti-floridani]
MKPDEIFEPPRYDDDGIDGSSQLRPTASIRRHHSLDFHFERVPNHPPVKNDQAIATPAGHLYQEGTLSHESSRTAKESQFKGPSFVGKSKDDNEARSHDPAARRPQYSHELESDTFKVSFTPPAVARKGINPVLETDHPQDVTVHLDLPICDDFSAELEQFACLVRFGDFRAANDYFEEQLADYRIHPYVFVQYAEMLLEMGDYKTLGLLKPESVFGMSSKVSNYAEQHHTSGEQRSREPPRHVGKGELEELDLLRLEWDLMSAMSIIYRQGTVNLAINTARAAVKAFTFGPEVGSTEV